jgi:hypothetical protein
MRPSIGHAHGRNNGKSTPSPLDCELIDDVACSIDETYYRACKGLDSDDMPSPLPCELLDDVACGIATLEWAQRVNGLGSMSVHRISEASNSAASLRTLRGQTA